MDLHAFPCVPNSARPNKNAAHIEAIASAITPVELALLAQYLHDGMTQMQLKEMIGVSQTTVSVRLNKAARKLRLAGIPVKFPGRGRRKRVQFDSIDPHSINGLETQMDDEGIHGKWNADKNKIRRN